MSVKNYIFEEIICEFKNNLSKEKFLEIFSNKKKLIPESYAWLISFIKNNHENLTSIGVQSMTEFIGRLLFCKNKNYIPASTKQCYSYQQGSEALFYDYDHKQLYIYEAKSTDIVDSKSLKHSHGKIIEANTDLTKKASNIKLRDLDEVENKIQAYTMPKTNYEKSNLNSDEVEDLEKQLDLISVGKPKNVFTASHYNGKKDNCGINAHKHFYNTLNFTFNLSIAEFKKTYEEILRIITNE